MRQKLFLQSAVTTACIVPVSAGLLGMINGGGGNIDIDSHLRYLSGLLFGIGIAFLTTIPKIETHKARFRLLTLIVFIGGLARLYGVIINGLPGYPMQFGLFMELLVTPLLCLWQHNFARKMQ